MVVLRFSIAIFTCLLVLTSCSKDEPDTDFEGAWLFQASEKRNCNDSDNNSGKNSDFVFSTPCTGESRIFCSYDLFVFDGTAYNKSSSSTFLGIQFSFNHAGSYSISGSTLTICREYTSSEDVCTVFEYSINGNSMRLEFINPETGCREIDYYKKQ